MSVLPVLLFAVAGVLIGGAVSLRRQGASTVAVLVLVVLAALAAVAGGLRVYG